MPYRPKGSAVQHNVVRSSIVGVAKNQGPEYRPPLVGLFLSGQPHKKDPQLQKEAVSASNVWCSLFGVAYWHVTGERKNAAYR